MAALSTVLSEVLLGMVSTALRFDRLLLLDFWGNRLPLGAAWTSVEKSCMALAGVSRRSLSSRSHSWHSQLESALREFTHAWNDGTIGPGG